MMRLGKWVLGIAAIALLLGGTATAQIEANQLCIHNGSDYYIGGLDHRHPNNGGGKYYPSYLHIPATDGPPWQWKIAGWSFAGMKATNFIYTTWIWESCLQYSLDNPYATTMTFVYPKVYCDGTIPHTGSYSTVYGGVVPTSVAVVGGQGIVYPSNNGSTGPYLNLFFVASGVWNIASTSPYYGWIMGWSLPCASAVTIPSAYSIYQFTWENAGYNQGFDMQYLLLSGNEMDCTGTAGGNKGKNYTIGSLYDQGYYYYWDNACQGADSEWAGCLFVCDIVSIPVNYQPASTTDKGVFAPYEFDVGSATVTPAVSTGQAYLQMYTNNQVNGFNGEGRILLAGWNASGGGTPYGPMGNRVPHSIDIFALFFLGIAPVWYHVTLDGFPGCLWPNSRGGYSGKVPIPPLPQLMCLELIYSSFSANGGAPSAGYMVCMF
jgi:hypothetical protein